MKFETHNLSHSLSNVFSRVNIKLPSVVRLFPTFAGDMSGKKALFWDRDVEENTDSRRLYMAGGYIKTSIWNC